MLCMLMIQSFWFLCILTPYKFIYRYLFTYLLLHNLTNLVLPVVYNLLVPVFLMYADDIMLKLSHSVHGLHAMVTLCEPELLLLDLSQNLCVCALGHILM